MFEVVKPADLKREHVIFHLLAGRLKVCRIIYTQHYDTHTYVELERVDFPSHPSNYYRTYFDPTDKIMRVKDYLHYDI